MISAYVFYVEFSNLRTNSLALLATAYGFPALAAVPYLLVFPGVFSPTGLFGATPHTSLLLWIVWHGGFAALMLATMIVYRRRATVPADRVRGVITLSVAASVAVTIVATLAVVVFGNALPPLVVDGRFAPIVTHVILPVIVAFDLYVLVQIYDATRVRSTLGLWLCISVLCSALDVFMGTVAPR